MMDSEVTLFPEPDSAYQAIYFPTLDMECDAIYCGDDAILGIEIGLQVSYIQQGTRAVL